ncbi:hypothetical protein [Vibrio sp. EA2]|uniref:hypothetical protein n=1 Tax=Vibrio sp. EA2 TaxID=3079860 RepID=UPI00294A2B0C|nr:hypothetical protein [Vibrio sp. EA2]MDV6250869.1 hypothetical protein [Vibrio sp. EA2]
MTDDKKSGKEKLAQRKSFIIIGIVHLCLSLIIVYPDAKNVEDALGGLLILSGITVFSALMHALAPSGTSLSIMSRAIFQSYTTLSLVLILPFSLIVLFNGPLGSGFIVFITLMPIALISLLVGIFAKS